MSLESEQSLEKRFRWIDSHVHLDFDRFDDDRHAVIERAIARGVQHMISIGTRVESSRRAIQLAKEYPDLISATAGFHPLYMDDDNAKGWEEIRALMNAPEVVGIGETGLDYYYDQTDPEQQRRSLRKHVQLSNEFNKPLVIHIRDAFDDAFQILKEEGVHAGGVVHCFTGGPQECTRALELGLYVSISGIATFKSAKPLRRAVSMIPADRLLIETDAPFLAPHPHRGERNEPSFVVDTAHCVAKLRGDELSELSKMTYANTCRLFNLTPPEKGLDFKTLRGEELRGEELRGEE